MRRRRGALLLVAALCAATLTIARLRATALKPNNAPTVRNVPKTISENVQQATKSYPSADMTLHVLTYDRPRSAERLISSLRSATYPPTWRRVDLIVHVDQGGKFEGAEWDLGNLTVHRAANRLGLLGQWINAWRPNENDGDDSIHVILEDDLEVSAHFAWWFESAHAASAADDSIVAVTGQRPQLRARGSGTMADAIAVLPETPRAVLYRLMSTWSWSPKKRAWMDFIAWYESHRKSGWVPRVPGIVPDMWYSEFLKNGVADLRMWEMWVIAWMAGKPQPVFAMYPWAPHQTTIVANHRERGQNYRGNLGKDHSLSAIPWTVTRQELLEVPRLDWDGLPIRS